MFLYFYLIYYLQFDNFEPAFSWNGSIAGVNFQRLVAVSIAQAISALWLEDFIHANPLTRISIYSHTAAGKCAEEFSTENNDFDTKMLIS